MMISNRYSCFLLYGEGEVDDVSVAEARVSAKKKESSVGGTSRTSNKEKISDQAPGKQTPKGKNQPQVTKTSVPGPRPIQIVKKFAPAVNFVLKDSTDSNNSKSAEKFGKGKVKVEHNQNEPQRFQRNRWADAPKKEEMVEENEPVIYNDYKDENEVVVDEEGGDVEGVGEDEMVEEAKLMTLAEWKAMQQPREKPVYNLRQPGEGEDLSQWTKMVLKKDNKEEEAHASDEFEYAENEYPQRAARHKKLEIDCLFVGLPREKGRGDGERDLRNKGRKNINRRKFDEDQLNRSAPKVDDINDFPSLG